MTLKLTTRPTTTATERHLREPGAVPVAPATRTMGSTGRMQGEMPVMSPATKPTRRRLSIPFRELAYPRPSCGRQRRATMGLAISSNRPDSRSTMACTASWVARGSSLTGFSPLSGPGADPRARPAVISVSSSSAHHRRCRSASAV